MHRNGPGMWLQLHPQIHPLAVNVVYMLKISFQYVKLEVSGDEACKDEASPDLTYVILYYVNKITLDQFLP